MDIDADDSVIAGNLLSTMPSVSRATHNLANGH
jgi:hypothetical protein